MPSKDSKTPGKDDANVVKFTAKEEKQQPKPKKNGGLTVSKIVTYIILGLLAIVLVVGVFPSFGSQGASTSIKFGSYDGTPIEFAMGNYFYRQYQNIARENRGSGDSAAYQIWRGAFENTVFHTAMSKRADRAGIRVVDETLNKAIIDSGIYNKDGKFDVATYESSSLESRNQIRVSFQDNLPAQMVMQDVATVLSAPAELEYIVKMGDSARTFSYALFDASLYPDDLTRQYAMANPAVFTLIDVSVITVGDQETAESLRASIGAQTTSFEDAARGNSLDSFADNGGKAGVWYHYELEENFLVPEEVNLLFSTPVGQLSQVFAAPGGYVLYRVDGSPFIADFEDPEVLADVKSYIGMKDPQVVDSFLQEKASQFAATAGTADDFAALAESMQARVVSVNATPANIGGSSYLSSFAYTDAGGYLRLLSEDATAMGSLYGAAVGSITGPFLANNAYVVAKITGEQPMDDQTRDYMRMVYPYMAQSQIQQDLVQSIFTSGKLVDNFFPVFLEQIMGL